MDVRHLAQPQKSRYGTETEVVSTGQWVARVVPPVPVYPNFSQLLAIVIPDIDAYTVWFAKWRLQHTDSFINLAEAPEAVRNVHISTPVWPVLGNEALVVFDNRQSIWVVSYR